MNTIDIQSALDDAQLKLAETSTSAALDAEVLLCHCLSKTRSFLRAWPEQHLTAQQSAIFRDLIQRRQAGMPVAYLTGVREFWSRDFQVTCDVLIPRPETELLVELCLNLIPPDQAFNIIDLGTGSGIIAITLAAERPLSRITAVDISEAALTVAKQNARRHHVHNISFLRSNWFNELNHQQYALVISNPPYIAADDPHLGQGDVRFEPEQALIAASCGLADIDTIAQQASKHLLPHGYLLMEHGYDQQQSAQRIFEKYRFQHIKTYTDLSNNPRVTVGLRHR